MKRKKPEKLNIEMCLELGTVREMIKAQGQEMKALHATITRLTAELVEAKEDSARLLESLRWSESYWPEPEESRHCSDCCCHICEVNTHIETARAAIDAARKGE